jgi:hypothetical protein
VDRRFSRQDASKDLSSRRDFLGQTLAIGAVLPAGGALAAAGSLQSTSALRPGDAPLIRVDGPAGPPPLGAPVETSVPFRRGQLRDPESLTVFSPDRNPVVTQTRTSATWADGSVRWLSVVFEPSSGPGEYVLKEGNRPKEGDLLQQTGTTARADSGPAVLTFRRAGERWQLDGIQAKDGDGVPQPVLAPGCCDVVLQRHDGTLFRAGWAKDNEFHVDDNGPVKASVRLQGKLRSVSGNDFFTCILRWSVYRARPEIHFSVTWVHDSENLSEKIRDIRVVFPVVFPPERVVFGCERGVYDGPFLKNWPVFILQEEADRYWARTLNPDGRVQHLSSGGCTGERAPGWLYVRNSHRCLGAWVPNFREEFPNELLLGEDGLSFGLWPERAAARLASGPVLPSNPFGDRPYSHSKYWPVMPHPYVAFLDPEKKCLDSRQGMAKTQEIVLSVWAGAQGEANFEQKWLRRSLKPVRGHLDPAYAASSGALGILSPRSPKLFPKAEELFEENFQWLDRHIDQLKCYGKFDYGDFMYMVPGTDYMCHPGTKWGDMGEMPREGYWHNNERDALLGLLLYYYRTGSPRAWERCCTVSRHLFDLDISHYPDWGMWTHGYGHCYLAEGRAGAPDHSWLLGMLIWAQMTGDPVALDWILRCGETLRRFKRDYSITDARTVSVYLHMMCQFYQATNRAEYLESTHLPAQTLVRFQKANGGWPAYLGNPRQTIEGFVEHIAMALADYYAITRDDAVLKTLDRAIEYLFGRNGEKDPDPGESSLALYSLAVLGNVTGDPKYVRLGTAVLDKLHAQLDMRVGPVGRGDPWTQWGINNRAGAPAGREAQLLGQTRPLSPVSNLAYAQPLLGAAVIKSGR